MWSTRIPLTVASQRHAPPSSLTSLSGRAAFGGSEAPGWAWRQRLDNGHTPGAGARTGASGASVRSSKLARVEAVLFVADQPVSARRLVQLATLTDVSEARELLERLESLYQAAGSPFHLETVAAGYRLMTRPEYAFWLNRLHQRQSEARLTPSTLETLTIIAYRGPLTRAEIEQLRGVQCAEVLKQLMERGLVRIAGEDTSLGRPFLYETTRSFLELFGLASLDQLPDAKQLRRPARGTGSAAVSSDAAA